MIFLGHILVTIECDIDGKIESIPVHYKKQTQDEIVSILENGEKIDILKKSCRFDDKKDEKRFYEPCCI